MLRISEGPGVVRYALGDAIVVALHDGHVDMPPSRLRQAGGPLTPDLSVRVATVGGKLRLSVNAFLVEDHGTRTLIDTGAGDAWEPTMGGLLRSLAAAGVGRDEIDTVALTHTHLDHVGGLVASDGTDVFPGARRIVAPRAEADDFARGARLARFCARHTPFGDGHAVTPGIRAMLAAGHEGGTQYSRWHQAVRPC